MWKWLYCNFILISLSLYIYVYIRYVVSFELFPYKFPWHIWQKQIVSAKYWMTLSQSFSDIRLWTLNCCWEVAMLHMFGILHFYQKLWGTFIGVKPQWNQILLVLLIRIKSTLVLHPVSQPLLIDIQTWHCEMYIGSPWKLAGVPLWNEHRVPLSISLRKLPIWQAEWSHWNIYIGKDLTTYFHQLLLFKLLWYIT